MKINHFKVLVELDIQLSNLLKDLDCFNGKELQDELGLNVYDREACNYMPNIGRWNVEANVEATSCAGQIMTALNQITVGDSNSFGSQFLDLFPNDNMNVKAQQNPRKRKSDNINGTTQDGANILTSCTQEVNTQITEKYSKSNFQITDVELPKSMICCLLFC